ncbi:hypothetical protein CSKR_203352, partial [Clonorchis sinensis]
VTLLVQALPPEDNPKKRDSTVVFLGSHESCLTENNPRLGLQHWNLRGLDHDIARAS